MDDFIALAPMNARAHGCMHMHASAGIMEAECHSALYRASMEYFKAKGVASEYYKNAVLYLTYTPLHTIEAKQQESLAAELSLAALVGEEIYNFGELLQQPVVNVLQGTQFEWIVLLLKVR